MSPVMVANATERWGSLGVRFVCTEVLSYLSGTTETYDAVYSVFGAVWFTDPARLLPLIAARPHPEPSSEPVGRVGTVWELAAAAAA